MNKKPKTAVIMVSIGERTHLTDYTYIRIVSWAEKYGYSPFLVKELYADAKLRSPHFTKLMAHKIVGGFQRYIIVDDDILLSENAPEMENVPHGFVGMCRDAVQGNTLAKHVNWTANSGFIVCDSTAVKFLEMAYEKGIYEPKISEDQIWGPFDQAILNDIVFSHNSVFELDWRWNYQCVIDYYSKTIGWEKWKSSRFQRIFYYLSLIIALPSKSYKMFRSAYGIHMTMGVYPKFFSKIH